MFIEQMNLMQLKEYNKNAKLFCSLMYNYFVYF